MSRRVALLLPAVVAFVCLTGFATQGIAAGQSAAQDNHRVDLRQLWELREGVYQESHLLGQLPSALPAYLAGVVGLLLLAELFGLFEMSVLTNLVLLTVMGGIVYKFYWPPWH